MSTTSAVSTGGQTILIIDDTPTSLRVAVEYMEALGFRVLIAQDGPEGLQRAALVRPDLILLDVMMPGIDGLETCRRLKENAATWDIPVIFMTSLAEPEAKVAGFRAGAVDYVSKPLQIDELAARVTTHLALFAERRRAQTLLYRREQEFRALAENAPDLIGRFDTECRFLYANPALERMLDMPLAAFMGKSITELGPRAGGAVHLEPKLCEVIESGTPSDTEVDHCMSDPAHHPDPAWHQVRLVPERGPDGRIVSVLAVGRDISALKEAERRLEESNAQLRDLTRRRESAREEERKRIAREIHDELGQHLTALRMGVSVLRLEFGADNPLLVERVGALMALADRAIQVVRDVASSLRPGVLNMGLPSALEWLADEFCRHAGLICHLELPDEKIVLDDKRATALFRIVQESLTNAARHAEASQVDIRLERCDDGYRLEVCDNGKGFDPAVRRKNAYGLLGIHERGLMLGGDVAITSAPGKGTCINVSIPAHHTEEAE